MSIYDAYAPLYDGSGQIRFALLTDQYLKELLERHPIAGKRLLEVACGTGTLALLLAEAGWHVLGLDAAPAMLLQARAKATHVVAPGSLGFVEGDMRQMIGHGGLRPGAFDLATCSYDSLNYLQTEQELRLCFAGVAWALADGGLFVADMNTRWFLEHDWGTCEVVEQPGYVQVGQSHFDAHSGRSTLQLTGFLGDDKGGYTRFDETHVERAYAPELVSSLLEQAGLQVEATYDSFSFQQPSERTQRIFWVARKTVIRSRP